MQIEITGKLVIEEKAREWCRLPYPDHPKGCPNYGKSVECPPKVKRVSEVFDLTEPHYFIIEMFDIKEHAIKLKMLHPGWSDKQCRCCLYWQNGVRKRLRSSCADFLYSHPCHTYTLIPEAMGVDVFETARSVGLVLQRNPESLIYKIALIGKPNKNVAQDQRQAVVQHRTSRSTKAQENLIMELAPSCDPGGKGIL